MATAPQKMVLEVIKNKVMEIDERYEGYHTELTRALYDILALESDRPHNIALQVSRRVTALGEYLVQKEGNLE
ncbi:hypothetical protein [Gimesia fumaroli]|uniref:Uncharacterized protein n=1 Tax=Gimesia fumaroli TaxID=2527976 RepID=A0A518I5X3_9PLAN|nr:hypothetical protein [Gimesia fumaroli]QDV48458.1 hypothetical protein Enr17x_04700 [Gimesia fumaroli]